MAARSTVLALCLALCVVPSLAAYDFDTILNQKSLQSGDLTSYGTGNDAAGACSYGSNFANVLEGGLPWQQGTQLTVAMNEDQWANSAACGTCVLFRGTGTGIGTEPVPTSEWQYALVTNRCPECAHGSLDMANDGNGRWQGDWFAVPCHTGDTPMHYSIVVSSYYWFSMVVSNTRVPVKSVELNLNNQWVTMTATSNNQYAYYNTLGPWNTYFPLHIRVTSVTGETVDDYIPSKTGGVGSAQFTDTGIYSGITSAATDLAALPAGLASSFFAPGTTSTPAAPQATSPAASTPASPSPSPSQSPSPVAASPSPAVNTTSPAPSGNTFPIINYGQCGGSAGVCGEGASTPCAPKPWPNARCSAGFSCVAYKGDTSFFECQPGTSPSPSPSTSPAAASPSPAEASPSPSPVAASPSPAEASPSPSPVTRAPVQLIPSATAASPKPASPTEASPSASPSATPSPASSPSPAESTSPSSSPSSSPSPSRSPSPAASPPPAPSSPAASPPPKTPSSSAGSFGIGDGNQCGGSGSNCGQEKTPCQDAQWSEAYCSSSGSTCTRQYAQLWLCQNGGSSVGSTATGGRKLLQGSS